MYIYNVCTAECPCGCAGCDGQSVMKDVRRDIQCTCTVESP